MRNLEAEMDQERPYDMELMQYALRCGFVDAVINLITRVMLWARAATSLNYSGLTL